jgi:hypothetical protein
VDDGVERAQSVGLVGNGAASLDCRDIAHNHRLRLRERATRVRCPCRVARVKYDLMALRDKQFAGHQAEAF